VVIELAVDIEPAGMCFKMQLFYNIPRSRELKISAVNLACCIKRDPPPLYSYKYFKENSIIFSENTQA